MALGSVSCGHGGAIQAAEGSTQPGPVGVGVPVMVGRGRQQAQCKSASDLQIKGASPQAAVVCKHVPMRNVEAFAPADSTVSHAKWAHQQQPASSLC